MCLQTIIHLNIKVSLNLFMKQISENTVFWIVGQINEFDMHSMSLFYQQKIC